MSFQSKLEPSVKELDWLKRHLEHENLVFPRKLGHHRPKYHVNSGGKNEKKEDLLFSEHWTLRMIMPLWFWARNINANILLFCDVSLSGEILFRPVLVKAIVVASFSLSLQTCLIFKQENPGFSSSRKNHFTARNNSQPVLFPGSTNKGNPREEAQENNPEGFATVTLHHGKQARQRIESPQSPHLYQSIE